jgi:hypothetical protein
LLPSFFFLPRLSFFFLTMKTSSCGSFPSGGIIGTVPEMEA